jgi:hypothetical protein
VQGWRKEKSNPDFADGRADAFRRNIERNSQRLQHIR